MKLALRILRDVLIAIAALAILSVAAVEVAVNTPLSKKIIASVLQGKIEGKVDYSRLHLSLFREFPDVTLGADSLCIIYPHRLFESYDAFQDGNPLYGAGRGSDADTLARFDRLFVSVDIREALSGRIHIDEATFGNLRMYLHAYEGKASNLDVFKFQPKQEPDTSSFAFPSWLSFTRMALDAAVVYTSLDNTTLIPLLSGISGTLDASLSSTMERSDKVNASLDRMQLTVPGLSLSGAASVLDIFSGNPEMSLSAKAYAQVGPLLRHLPRAMKISGGGDLAFNVDASASLEGLRTLTADLDAGVRADGLSVSLSDNLELDADNLSLCLSDSRSSSVVRGSLDAGALKLRSGESLAVRIKDMHNALSIESESPDELTNVRSLKISDRTGRIGVNFGATRIGLKDVDFSADATRRPQDVPGWKRRVPPDSLRARYARPDYLSDTSFVQNDIRIALNDGLTSLLKQWRPRGSVSIGKGRVISPSLPLKTRLRDISLGVTDENLEITSMNASVGESDISLEGTLNWRLGRSEKRKGMVGADLDIKSTFIDADELLFAIRNRDKVSGGLSSGGASEAEEDAYEKRVVVVDTIGKSSRPDTMKLIVIPANVNARVKFDVDSLKWEVISAGDVGATVNLRERTLQIRDASVRSDLGRLNADAFYSTRTRKDISAGVDLSLQDVTADKVISLLPSADSLMPVLRSFKGLMSMNVAATAKLDTCMNVLMPTIDAVVQIKGNQMRIDDAGKLRKVTRLLLFRDKNIGALGDLSVNAVIHDNRLQVFPFVFKADRYTLVLNGQQNLDGRLNYMVSVVKWPLLMRFGINLDGSFEKWRIRLRRPAWWNENIPKVDESMESMRQDLKMSIINVYKYSPGAIFDDNRRRHEELERMRCGIISEAASEAALSPQEEKALSEAILDGQNQEENEELMKDFSATLSQLENEILEIDRQISKELLNLHEQL